MTDLFESPTSQNCFTFESDKTFPEPQTLVAGCPKMDMVAVVTASGDLSTFRIPSWQKIWSIPVEKAEIQTLAWRPDGKALAVGYSNGKIKILDSESSSLLNTISLWDEVIISDEKPMLTSLYWIDETKRPCLADVELSQNVSKDITQFLPTLTSVPKRSLVPLQDKLFQQQKKDDSAEKRIAQMDGSQLKKMSMLVAGDSYGNVHLSVYGFFNLETCCLRDIGSAYFQNPTLLNLSVSPDFSAIHVLISANSEPEYQSSSPSRHQQSQAPTTFTQKSAYKPRVANVNADGIYLVTLDTELLHLRKLEIRELALKSTQISSLLNYISEATKTIQKDYTGMASVSRDHIRKLQDKMVAHGLDTSPKTQFMMYLGTGIASDALVQWISNDLNNNGIKRWEKSIENAYDNIRKSCHMYVIPAVERLMAFMSDMMGFAKWEDRFQVMGLNENQVYACIALAGALRAQLEELLLTISLALSDFKEFMQFLQHIYNTYVTTRNAETDQPPSCDTEKILRFLNQSLDSDGLERFFVDKLDNYDFSTFIRDWSDVSVEAKKRKLSSTSHQPYRYVFPSRPDDDVLEPSIQAMVKVLCGRCGSLFDGPSRSIGASITVSSITKLVQSNAIANLAVEYGQRLYVASQNWKHRFIQSMTVVHSPTKSLQYVAYCINSSISDSPPALWILRYPAEPASSQHHNANNVPPSPTKKTSHVEATYISLKTLSGEGDDEFLKVSDIDFYTPVGKDSLQGKKDGSLMVVLSGKPPASEEETSYLVSLDYERLEYSSLTIGTPTPSSCSLVDEYRDKSGGLHGIVAERVRVMKNVRPERVVVHGERDFAHVLGQYCKKIQIFHLGDDEEEDEGDEDEVEGGGDENANMA